MCFTGEPLPESMLLINQDVITGKVFGHMAKNNMFHNFATDRSQRNWTVARVSLLQQPNSRAFKLAAAYLQVKKGNKLLLIDADKWSAYSVLESYKSRPKQM